MTRCTSLLRVVVSEMTYNVSSGTLNSTIPYHILFRSNLVGRCRLQFHDVHLTKKSKFWQFKMADGRHFENCFILAISRRYIGRFMQVSEWRWRIACRYQSLDQNGNFHKFKMADGHHFENSFISIYQPRIIRFRSYLVCLCKFPYRRWLFDKIEIFQIQDGGRTPYWKSFFGYISAPYWPINAKFETEMKDHMPI